MGRMPALHEVAGADPGRRARLATPPHWAGPTATTQRVIGDTVGASTFCPDERSGCRSYHEGRHQAPMSQDSWSQAVTEARRFRYMLNEGLAEQARSPRFARHRPSRGPTAGSSPTRIALLATPRSGNTWLRLILGHILELEELPVHHPGDLDWTSLPERVVIQLHWPRTKYLQSLLEGAKVKVVTLSRHPFDILVSILRFAQTEPETIGWLWGRGGDEEGLLDVDPASQEFAQWATSERALNLLDVTGSWLNANQVEMVSYERLVSSPEEEVDRLLKRLSLLPVRPIAGAVHRFTPDSVNGRKSIQHTWTATTDMWREVIPSDLAVQLSTRYGHQLQQLGFTATLDSKTDRSTARTRWLELYPEPDPCLPDGAYRAEVRVLDPPSTVPSRSSFACLVKLHNHGTVRWPNRLRHPLIRLGCRWHSTDRTGTVVLEDRYILCSSVKPGDVTYEHAIFATPPEPGRYILHVDLVHEDHRWFESGRPTAVTVL